MMLCYLTAFCQNKSTSLSGEVNFKKDGDTISLILFKEGYFNSAPESEVVYKTIVKNRQFRFKLESFNHPAYFTLNFGSIVVNGYMIEANDDIFISAINPNNQLCATGKGSEKFNIKSQLNALDNSILTKLKRDQPDRIVEDFKLKDSVFILKKELLISKKGLLNEVTFSLILSDIISQNYSKSYYITHYQKVNRDTFLKALRTYSDPINKLDTYKLNKLPEIAYSNEYVSSIISKYQFDSCYVKRENFNVRKCYEHLDQSYEGNLRDKLLTFLIYSNKKSTQAMDLVDKLMPTLHNAMYISILNRIKKMGKIGARAYEFSLPDENDKVTKLFDMKGKVVVIDFWYTGCPACPQVVPYLSSLKKRFDKKDVEIISISIDKNKKVWLNSINKNLYTTSGELNLYTEGLGDSHPIIRHYDIKGYPALLIIDKNGNMCEIPIDPRVDDGKSLERIINAAL